MFSFAIPRGVRNYFEKLVLCCGALERCAVAPLLGFAQCSANRVRAHRDVRQRSLRSVFRNSKVTLTELAGREVAIQLRRQECSFNSHPGHVFREMVRRQVRLVGRKGR